MEADINLEEGEILDDDDNYTPLERPSTFSSELYQARFPVVEDVESEEEFESTSESDSDEGTKSKRPKLKLKPQAVSSKSNVKKKYDVWSTRVQEDLLLENLVNCDVSRVDRSRTVETYSTNHVPFIRSNKRTHEDRYNPHLRPPKRSNSDNECENARGTSRVILDVHVTVDNSNDEVAKDIANKLCEEKEDLIRTIVVTAGKAKALELFKETQRIEKGGGMMIMNQSRRRTPGGVFLFLVKHDNNLTREQMMTIFNEERAKYKQEVRLKRKLKLQQMKQKISASKLNSNQSLPELLTRAELCTKELEDQERVPKDLDVKNPPPSPVTDGHDNSTDGMENLTKDADIIAEHLLPSRNVISYEDDFIDVGVDMDLL